MKIQVPDRGHDVTEGQAAADFGFSIIERQIGNVSFPWYFQISHAEAITLSLEKPQSDQVHKIKILQLQNRLKLGVHTGRNVA